MIILVNGRNIQHLKGVDTLLGPDDIVAVFPMVAGG
jgi:molybdopterin converting factor small subunit